MTQKRLFQSLALFTTIAGLLAAVWLMTQSSSPLYQPIKEYELVSEINQVSKTEIDEVVKKYFDLSFWNIPLGQIQGDLTRLDWVKSAEVKRQWPDLLFVSISEQKPIARWNEDGLINGFGEVFFPKQFAEYSNLVKLEGELDNAATILQQLIQLQQQLDGLEMLIEKLNYNDEVWRIYILNGPEIVVDKADFDNKIERFVRAYPQVETELRKSARIYDLRYSNGFIIANN